MPEPAPRRELRTLTASPKMRARLGLVEPPPANPIKGACIIQAPSPPKPEPAPQPDRKPRSRGRGVYDPAIDAMLRERWPVVFCVPRVPLAIGVRERILEAAGDAPCSGQGQAIDPMALGRFLHWWCNRPDYLDAVAYGELRRNLDGSPAGEPDEPQRREAARQVYGARAEAVLARIAARRAAEMEAALCAPVPGAADGA
jgi:hypothetical protein